MQKLYVTQYSQNVYAILSIVGKHSLIKHFTDTSWTVF